MHTELLGQAQGRDAGGTFPTSDRSSDPSAGHYLAVGLGSHQVLTCTMVCVLLLVFVVIVPAIWSTSETRRTAAQEVLDKLLRFLRPRH